MSGSESYVQVQPDSTGRKVKTVQTEEIVSSSVVQTEVQAVALTDESGFLVGAPMTEETGQNILRELYRIRKGISLLVGDPLLNSDEGI
jgi:hypothetical protein